MSAFERIEIDYESVAEVLRSPELHVSMALICRAPDGVGTNAARGLPGADTARP
jgi:hypothetical protein